MKYLVLIPDGMADEKIASLGNKTPMEAADKAVMDSLAKRSFYGLVQNVPEGMVPDSVKWSFYIGAALLILCVLYTFFTVKELNPQEYAAFHGLDKTKEEKKEQERLQTLMDNIDNYNGDGIGQKEVK